jgi:hypothetical protein
MFQFLFIDRSSHNKIYDLMKSCCIQERITTPLTRCRQVEQHHLYPAPFSSRQDGRGAWHGGIGLSPWPHDARSRASSSQPFIHSLLADCV